MPSKVKESSNKMTSNWLNMRVLLNLYIWFTKIYLHSSQNRKARKEVKLIYRKESMKPEIVINFKQLEVEAVIFILSSILLKVVLSIYDL